jgi:hypothetical protein
MYLQMDLADAFVAIVVPSAPTIFEGGVPGRRHGPSWNPSCTGLGLKAGCCDTEYPRLMAEQAQSMWVFRSRMTVFTTVQR